MPGTGGSAMVSLLRTMRIVGYKKMLKLFMASRVGYVDIISGMYTTYSMNALFNVGFFDKIKADGFVDIHSFAQSRNLDEKILRSLCDSLYSLRILKMRGQKLVLDRKGKVLVNVARGWFEIVDGYKDVMHSLESMLKGEKQYGKDIFRNTEWVAKGSGEIENWIFFPLAASIVQKKGYRKVLDLGCGDGTFLRRMCERDQDITGFGIDIAKDAIDDGCKKNQLAGLGNRIRLLSEDVCKIEKLPKAFRQIDVAFTYFVPHEILAIREQKLVEFLKSYIRLFPDIPLIVFEAVRPTPEEMRSRPGPAIQYFLYHDLTHQKPVSRKEWKRIFRLAGFNSIKENYMGFARTAIFTLSSS
jgi:SAM-dependent methyltransferase